MFGFMIAVAAGALTPMIEAPLARPIAGMLEDRIDVTDGEMRVLAFMIAMIIAAILCAVFNSGSALGLIIGGTLGYFGMRIVRVVQNLIESRGD